MVVFFHSFLSGSATRDNLGIPDAAQSPAEQAARLGSLDNTGIKKQLPPSDTGAFAFERSRTGDADVGDEFGCALRDVIGGEKNDPKPSDQVPWGKVIAHAPRQPELASKLGLLYARLMGSWHRTASGAVRSAGDYD